MLSQQLKYETPSSAGQHWAPRPNPSAAQRGARLQSDFIVGDKLGASLGLADGSSVGAFVGLVDGELLGRAVLHSPKVHTSLVQSPSTRQLRPTSQRGHTRPPQSIDVSSPLSTISVHDAAEGDPVGLVVGDSLGIQLGDPEGARDGAAVVGAVLGASVLSQHGRKILPSPAVGQH